MGIVAGLTAAAAAASLGSTVYGMTQDEGNAYGTYGGDSRSYMPEAVPRADALYQDIFNNMSGYTQALPGQIIPQYQQYAQNVQNNPFAASALGGAVSTGAMGAGGAGSLYGAANEVLATGFDPQNALYDRSVQRLRDQFAANNAMSGVAGPYAAGVANSGLSNFALDWENQQLDRQVKALTSAGQGYTGAFGLGAQATQLPYNVYHGQQVNNLGALDALSTGYNKAFDPSMRLASLLQSYMGLGQSASGLAQQGAAQQFKENTALGEGFGSSLESLSNLYDENSGSLGERWNSWFPPGASGGAPAPSYVPDSYYTGGAYG